MHISDEDLLSLNLQGIIPGPGESEEGFLSRAAYCRQLHSRCRSDYESLLPCIEESGASQNVLNEAFQITRPLYGIAPVWIPMAFSNYKLAPWHGGSAWIFQAEEDSPTGAFMQLRQQFRHQKKYLGLYRRDELIAHELAHVGRMMFEEPQFEELLAYRCSFSPMRRWLGPIVQASWESLLFMLSLLLLLILDLYLQAVGEIETYQLLLWAKLIPLSLLVLGAIRLCRRQRVFKTCLAHLKSTLNDKTAANAVIFRLTDKEIHQFAAMDREAIISYGNQARHICLRWRLIWSAYFAL